MTTTLRVTFDGKMLVPDGPVDLSIGSPLTMRWEPVDPPLPVEKTGLQRLLELAEGFPANPDAPTDGAAQHDHYLYGTPKRETP